MSQVDLSGYIYHQSPRLLNAKSSFTNKFRMRRSSEFRPVAFRLVWTHRISILPYRLLVFNSSLNSVRHTPLSRMNKQRSMYSSSRKIRTFNPYHHTHFRPVLDLLWGLNTNSTRNAEISLPSMTVCSVTALEALVVDMEVASQNIEIDPRIAEEVESRTPQCTGAPSGYFHPKLCKALKMGV